LTTRFRRSYPKIQFETFRSESHHVLISICLPNLNTARFLPERIRSIQAQTLQDYEVVACDNYSDDGAFELLRDYAARDSRVRLEQRPREGMYPNWNNCVRLARGEWIYVATSDDTMTPDCLERLIAAARANSEACVITSLPWVINDAGRTLGWAWDRNRRWLAGRRYARSNWIDPEREILWGLIVGTPTLSITQMLVRREVFDRVGEFPVHLGSAGDYAWQMTALRYVRWFHVGRRLGSWRRHAAQATGNDGVQQRNGRAEMALQLFAKGILGESQRIQDALGYCVGMSELPVSPSLPEVSRARAEQVRRCGMPYNSFTAALLYSRFVAAFAR
jgi:hypothetical protein